MKVLAIFTMGLLLALLSCLPVQAGTFDNLHFIGFSKDGKYLAFEAYGISDGTGHGYSEITLIDVAKNAWVSRPIKTGDEAAMLSEEAARAQNRAKAAPRLAELGIVDGATGDHVFTRLLTDLTDYQEPVRFAEAVFSTFQRGDYELHLTERATSRADCDVYAPPVRKIFTLSLTNRNTNTQQILQQDRKMPKSRFCPFAYKIADVYMSNKRLVVFLRMYGPGFEGKSMRYLAVSGVIGE